MTACVGLQVNVYVGEGNGQVFKGFQDSRTKEREVMVYCLCALYIKEIESKTLKALECIHCFELTTTSHLCYNNLSSLE